MDNIVGNMNRQNIPPTNNFNFCKLKRAVMLISFYAIMQTTKKLSRNRGQVKRVIWFEIKCKS